MAIQDVREGGRLLLAFDQVMAANGVLVSLRGALRDAMDDGELDPETLAAVREEARGALRMLEESADVVRVLVTDGVDEGGSDGE
jgi:hypothetical protein